MFVTDSKSGSGVSPDVSSNLTLSAKSSTCGAIKEYLVLRNFWCAPQFTHRVVKSCFFYHPFRRIENCLFAASA